MMTSPYTTVRCVCVTPLLAALLAAGCSSLTTPTKRPVLAAVALPQLSPGGQVRIEPDLAIERWWTQFGDADLDRLVDSALQHNHDLAIGAARVQEARARLDEAHGTRMPSLDVQVSSGRARQSADGLPLGTPLTGSSHSAALVGRYEVDLWGRLASADGAARSNLLAQQWARASIQWSLTAQLAEVHFSLRAVQRQIDISQAVRTSRDTTLKLRQRERAAGIANEFDLRRAEAELAGTDSTLSTLRRQRASYEATLALLAGRPLAEVTDGEAARVPLDPSVRFQARLPLGDAAELLLRRPDVRQAEAQLAAAQADVSSARAATLPRLTLSGNAGSDVHSLNRLFDGPGMVWSVALGVTQNLFDGGAARSRVDQADARADAALAAYRRTVLVAVLELRESYARLEITQQAQDAVRARVAALERARALAALGHANGAFGYLDLLDAERNSYQAQLDEVGAYRDRLLGQVAAFKALGGGHGGTAIAGLPQPQP